MRSSTSTRASISQLDNQTSPRGAARPAVFLDRDGTLIEDRDYLADPDGVRLLPGAAQAVRRLNQAGYPVIVVTNQSGIGRGFYTDEDYVAVRDRIDQILAEQGAHIDATYHCPHAPDVSPPCTCRKPLPGLFEQAAAEHTLDLARSFFVGDRLRDLTPGLQRNAPSFLILSEFTDPPPYPAEVTVLRSLSEAVDRLLGPVR